MSRLEYFTSLRKKISEIFVTPVKDHLSTLILQGPKSNE